MTAVHSKRGLRHVGNTQPAKFGKGIAIGISIGIGIGIANLAANRALTWPNRRVRVGVSNRVRVGVGDRVGDRLLLNHSAAIKLATCY